MANDTGYCDCACRDCFDVAIGIAGKALCSDCESADCDASGSSECERSDAYGCDDADVPACGFSPIPGDAEGDARHEFWDSDDAAYLLETLMDALNECAPDGYYFGAHPGDGADFGYWKNESEAMDNANYAHTRALERDLADMATFTAPASDRTRAHIVQALAMRLVRQSALEDWPLDGFRYTDFRHDFHFVTEQWTGLHAFLFVPYENGTHIVRLEPSSCPRDWDKCESLLDTISQNFPGADYVLVTPSGHVRTIASEVFCKWSLDHVKDVAVAIVAGERESACVESVD